MSKPTPKANLAWEWNPEYDGTGERPPMECGDRILIAVPLHENSGGGFDLQVIVATECGFDLNGESWSDWAWSDVEWFIQLDGKRSHCAESAS